MSSVFQPLSRPHLVSKTKSPSWREFDVDGSVWYADQPGHGAHRVPVVLHLEPLHHLRHHNVQLQPGKALPNARSEMAEYLHGFFSEPIFSPDPVAERKV